MEVQEDSQPQRVEETQQKAGDNNALAAQGTWDHFALFQIKSPIPILEFHEWIAHIPLLGCHLVRVQYRMQ